MDVLCVGLALCDIIVKPVSEDIFSRGATSIDNVDIRTGGNACNVAINISDLGFESSLVSVFGKDNLGSFIYDRISESNVDIDYSRKIYSHPTATSVVMVTPSGERHFLSSVDIFSELTPDFITTEMLKKAKVIALGGTYKLPALDNGGIAPIFKKARDLNVLTVMDTTWNFRGKNWLEKISENLKYTDVFLPSYEEAVKITGTSNISEMKDIMKEYPLKVFGVKLGKKGSFLTDFKEDFYTPAFNNNIVDTVGAGDAFIAGFICAWIRGYSLKDCGIIANAVASFNISHSGATGNIPLFKEIEKMIIQKKQATK